MNPGKIKNYAKGPEAKIQDAVINYLRQRQWTVMPTTGNMFQRGFPDLYAFQRRYGARWIEIKNPGKYKFTPAQWEFFPLLAAAGISVWIMTAATDKEYAKLFQKANLWVYMGGFDK